MSTLHIGHFAEYGDRERWYLPEDTITHTMAILAKKGAGKTYVAGVVEEEFAKNHLPFIVLDPVGVHYGIRSTVDGLSESPYPIVVFGGLHADIPLDEHMGEALAEAIIDENISCIIDLSELSKSAWRRFTRDFCRALFKKNSSPRHVFIEEATEFVPQTRRPEMQEAYEAVERMVRLGRNRGLGVTLIAQRSAQIAKDVLYALDVLIVLRTIGTLDKKAILDLVQDNIEEDGTHLLKQMRQSMASLPTGTAWIWSPEYLKCFDQVAIRARETYHGGATPTFEKTKLVQAKPDVSKLRERLAVVEPAELGSPKKRIDHALCNQSIEELRSQNETLVEHQKRMAEELTTLRIDASNFQTIRAMLTAGMGPDGERIVYADTAPIPKMEDIVREVLLHIPQNGSIIQVPPPEALRKKYLAESSTRIYERLNTVDDFSRRVMELLLSNPKFWPVTVISKALTGQDGGTGFNNTKDAVSKLLSANLVRKGGPGRGQYQADVEGLVKSDLAAHNPSEQEVGEVVNHVLSRLVTSG